MTLPNKHTQPLVEKWVIEQRRFTLAICIATIMAGAGLFVLWLVTK